MPMRSASRAAPTTGRTTARGQGDARHLPFTGDAVPAELMEVLHGDLAPQSLGVAGDDRVVLLDGGGTAPLIGCDGRTRPHRDGCNGLHRDSVTDPG